jgi:hypothetical protein
MKSLFDFCLRVKVIAVEVVSLVGFLGALAFVLYLEWEHFAPLLHK